MRAGRSSSRIGTSKTAPSWLYYAQGAYERAAPLYERALAIWEKALGADHPNTKTVRANLAALRNTASGAGATGQPSRPKPARNEPCPCGSGKRYKLLNAGQSALAKCG
ncbi:MAG: tetratricopeptide repeat protein [Rhodomicrobium sp.]